MRWRLPIIPFPWLVVLGLSLLVVMRLAWLDAYPLNSDEAQHAHVAWSWAQGLQPYRDTFDNHGPLFSWLHSWLMRVLGERADILWWLRLAMQVWYALALWALWRMGRGLFGSGVAFAGVMLAGVELRFFLVSGQFRTDDMWSAAWLCGLAVLVGASPRVWRWFLFGLAAGAALAISQKTVILLATSAVSAAVVFVACGVQRGVIRWWHVLAACLGLAAIPGVFAAWLSSRGLMEAAWYGLVTYNVGGVVKTDAMLKLALAVVIFLLLAVAVVRYLRARGRRYFDGAAFLLLQASAYLLLVWFVWPLVTAQDFLPAIPPLMLLLSAGGARIPWLRVAPQRATAIAVLAVLAQCALLLVLNPPWQDRLAAQREELRTVLRYTAAADTVMDPKGDAIYRRRPYFPVIESLALARFREGLMPDTVAEDMVAHGSMMVIHRRLPPGSDVFVWENFLPVQGDVWIAGQCVKRGAERDIQIAMPGDYTLVDGEGAVLASMDGRPLADHWNLSVGTHHLKVASSQPMALVWSAAWRRGWRPLASAQAAPGATRETVACR